MSEQLKLVERIIDASGAAQAIELLLPVGVRPRQLTARTLLCGMLLAMLAGADALLSGVLAALLALPEPDRRRLGIIADWRTGAHTLTYRQLEYTYRLISKHLAKPKPDGSPSPALSETLDRLLEASVQVLGEPASTSYAVDWTAHEAWSRPPPRQPVGAEPVASESDSDTTRGDSDTTRGQDTRPAPRRPRQDQEAAWGHRNSNHPAKSEIFYGYHLQALTIVKDEHGPQVPELARRMHLASCDHDPPAEIVPVIARMHNDHIPVGDLLADSGYAYRVPATWALPIRALGIDLIQDLHPADRGPHGTHQGATCANGSLYCPATPKPLLAIQPLGPTASVEQTATHDQQATELARYKLSAITARDQDGYHRVKCPAAQAKLRCPLRPESMTLSHQHPTILDAPAHPPACCEQQTITIPPSVNAKTAQKHDYPSKAHRASYARRTAAERTFSTLSDRSTNDLSRGWCRLTGLAPIALFTTTAIIARNIRIADAFAARQADNQQRAAQGLPPKQRRRRRQTTEDLITTASAPP